MSFADHFSSIAARYAAYRPRYPAALVDLLAERAGPGGVAWEVGCGNGQLSVVLAERFRGWRVIATDPAQAQLDEAVAHPRVEYRRASAEDSGLPAASVSLVVAAQAAHWFDWPRFVAEVERVAAPGALVALVSYGNVIVEDAAGEELARYHGAVARYWPPGREHVDNGYRDLAMPWAAVEAPSPLAMTAEWTRDELVGYASSWSATVRLLELEGAGRFDAFRAAIAAVWPESERRLVRWPLAVRLARR